MQKFRHTPSLDGLRAIAVLAVMVYHTTAFFPDSWKILPGGFLGVDIFFVLSGFLITCVLLREYGETGTVSLKKFYIRRFLRLMPAYWLFILVIVAFAWAMLTEDQARIIYDGYNVLIALVYATNWHSAYFEPSGHLNHTWSLAIEEQFYLLWPALLLLLLNLRGFGPKQVLRITIFIICSVIVLRLIRERSGEGLEVLYYSTETRIDSLLTGCVAAMAYMWQFVSVKTLTTKWFGAIACGATAVSAYLLITAKVWDAETYKWSMTVFTFCVALIILRLVAAESFAGRVLSWGPLTWIGRISYSLYLWHWLAFELARQMIPETNIGSRTVAGFSLAFLFASLSYYLVELRFLRLKERFTVTA